MRSSSTNSGTTQSADCAAAYSTGLSCTRRSRVNSASATVTGRSLLSQCVRLVNGVLAAVVAADPVLRIVLRCANRAARGLGVLGDLLDHLSLHRCPVAAPTHLITLAQLVLGHVILPVASPASLTSPGLPPWQLAETLPNRCNSSPAP